MLLYHSNVPTRQLFVLLRNNTFYPFIVTLCIAERPQNKLASCYVLAYVIAAVNSHQPVSLK